ncbi:hypothetical protein AGOR_G00131940 [Albula goreensis]|uniref:Uncharacterized protein n=1 Tax=Albula goreensis TaxID=1534307 RepID=A0A8T3D8B7_9TELE|nr:hypothetical protein AGOR_G00131940 [Albula goreensis]
MAVAVTVSVLQELEGVEQCEVQCWRQVRPRLVGALCGELLETVSPKDLQRALRGKWDAERAEVGCNTSAIEESAITPGDAHGDNQLSGLLKEKKKKRGVRRFFSRLWKAVRRSCCCCCVSVEADALPHINGPVHSTLAVIIWWRCPAYVHMVMGILNGEKSYMRTQRDNGTQVLVYALIAPLKN